MRLLDTVWRFAVVFPLVAIGAAPSDAATPVFDVPWVGYDTAVYPEGVGPWASAVADFDGNGVPDLATVSFEGTAHLSVLLADGNGGYRPPATYPLLLESLGVVAGDFDRDGDADIAVTDTDRFWGGSTVSLYTNDGKGHFARTSVSSAGNTGPSGLTAADFDGDGWLDLATAHDAYIVCNNTMAVLRNNHNGFFGVAQVQTLDSCTRSIASGDLDGDGDSDAVVGHESNVFSVLLNEGGHLSVSAVIDGLPGGFFSELPSVRIADVDRDGDNDILYSHRDTGAFSDGEIGLWRNNGDGSFGAAEAILLSRGNIVTNGGVGTTTADVTGDGWPDILAASENTHYWFLVPGDGKGGFLPARPFRAGETPVTVETADLDRDGDLEVVVVARGSQEACVYTNPGDGRFVQPPVIDMTSQSISPAFVTNLQAGDIDADGDLDLVVGYYSDFSNRRGISVRRNNGDGTFSPIEDYTDEGFNHRPAYVRLGDLDGDGDLDLAWLDESSRLKLRFNRGDGRFGAIVSARTLDGAFLVLYDVDRDGDLDVVYPGFFEVGISRNDGTGNFGQPIITGGFDSVPEVLALGDYDKNGVPDLLTNTAVQGYAAISFGQGNGTFGQPFAVPTGRDVHAFAVGDVDRDGNLDFGAFYNLDEKGLSIRRGRGDGNFFPLQNYHGSRGFNDHTSSLVLADADLDGDVDALTANFSPQDFSLWLNQGDGVYARGLRYGVAENAYDIALGDFTGDGKQDMAVVSQVAFGSWWYPGVTIFKGQAVAPTLVLGQTDLHQGQQATWTVTGAVPSETVRFTLSLEGVGPGPCRPQLGGLCLDLLPPVRLLGSAVADGAGVAQLTVTVPDSALEGSFAHAQAVAQRGPGGNESVKSNTSSKEVLP